MPAGRTATAAVLEEDGVVTVSVVEFETLPDVAVIVVVPAATGVASPLEPAVLLIVATEGSDELHVTDEVRFAFVPSE